MCAVIRFICCKLNFLKKQVAEKEAVGCELREAASLLALRQS